MKLDRPGGWKIQLDAFKVTDNWLSSNYKKKKAQSKTNEKLTIRNMYFSEFHKIVGNYAPDRNYTV